MSEVFDPYYKWLGIPPDEQPPNHYRLLGIQLFEADDDVIESAADARMTFLRSLQSGKNAEISQGLLNEVSAARLCLLNPSRKRPYDRQLETTRPKATPVQPTSVAVKPTRVAGGATPVAAPLVTSAATPTAPPATGAGQPESLPARRATRRRRRKKSPLSDPIVWTIIATCLIALLGVVAIVASGRRNKDDGKNSAGQEQRSANRGKVKVRKRPANRGKTKVADIKAKSGSTESTTADSGDEPIVLAPIQEGDWWILQPERFVAVDEASLKRYDDGSMLIEKSQAKNVYEFSTSTALPILRRLRIESLPLDDETPAGLGDKTLVVEELEFAAAPKSDEALEPAPMSLVPITSASSDAEASKAAALAIDGDTTTGWAAPLHERHLVEFSLRDTIEDKQGTRLVIRLHVNSKESPTGLVRRRLRLAISDRSSAPKAPSTFTRAPPPSRESQARFKQQIDKLYPAGESSNSDNLLKRVSQFQSLAGKSTDPAERFVLLRAAAETARDAGDARVLFATLDEIESQYEFEASLESRIQFLKQMAKTARTQDAVDSLVTASQEAIRRALAEGNYEAATDMVNELYNASQQPHGRRYRKMLFDTQKSIKKINEDLAGYLAAKETLRSKPDDGAAQLTVGRWLCFQRWEWKTGLEALGKSSDEQLKRLADLDLKSDVAAAIATGDGWWDAARETEDATQRFGMQRRAAHWYHQANLVGASELVRARVEKRIAEAAAAPPAGKELLQPMESVPLGVWFNVLARTNVELDKVAGEWERRRESIAIKTTADRARLNTPVAIEGSFVLDVDFTCVEGRDAGLTFPVGDRSARLVLATGRGNASSGLAEIDGKNVLSNPSKTAARIEAQRRYRLMLAVDVQDDQAAIHVELDGKPYIGWRGATTSLSPGAGWQPTAPKSISLLAANKSSVIYHAAYLKLVSGKASFLRPNYRFAHPMKSNLETP